ncbi:MAG: cation transporter [Oscillospiraceae bacterium]|nr:cation transporter [Oscillospiraceae bacterium]
MTELLIKLFVKDSENFNSPPVRRRYGLLTGIVGIICNVVLSAAKLVIGSVSGSIAVVSDAFNNISDCVSSLVTILGYKVSTKPADKKHPYGHGRTEYLASMFIGVLIVYLGVSLFVSSARKIISPEPVIPDKVSLIVLILSVLMKVWLTVFNKKVGTKINSPVMLATSQDARNDVFATSAAVIGVAAAYFTDMPVDGVMGALVSMYVCRSGLGVLKDTADDLIGRPLDDTVVDRITEIASKSGRIIGVHDILIHDYGPGRILASCNAEVDADEKLTEIHEVIDDAEREIERSLGIHITMHIDPVDTKDERIRRYRQDLSECAHKYCADADVHDFRILHQDTEPTIAFDILFPFGYTGCEAAEKALREYAAEHYPDYKLEIYVEHGFDGAF